MSLLESLRSFLGKRDQESRRPSAHPAAWPIDIDGSCEKTVYCYVGVVFKGVRKGAELYVDPLGHDVVLHSKSTGTTADSAEFGDAPLAYDGRPFGFAGSSLGFLKEMTAAGFTFRVKVKKVGMYSPRGSRAGDHDGGPEPPSAVVGEAEVASHPCPLFRGRRDC